MSARLRAFRSLVSVSPGAVMMALAVGVPAGANVPGPQFVSNQTHVAAHADATGSAKGNAGLALRRANEAAKLLKADTHGVLHVTVHVVTSASKNAVTVTTTKN